MKGLLGLTLITFWLTSFPLQGPLLPKKDWFLWFLFFHFIGYGILFLKFNWFNKFNFFSIVIIKIAILTALFPFFSEFFSFYIFILLALFSPLPIFKIFLLIKSEKNSFLPYIGLICGNWSTFFLQIFSLPKVYFFPLIGTGLIVTYFLKPKHFENNLTEETLKIPFKSLIYLFIAIFCFYLSGTLVYKWMENCSFQKSLHLFFLLLWYSLGIFLGIILRIKNLFSYKNIFLLSTVFLAFSKASLHLEKNEVYPLTHLFIFSASGIMDFITLDFFIKVFPNIRFLGLLYALINLALFSGNLLFKLSFYQKDYILSFLTLISLLTFLFLYKTDFKKVQRKKFTEESLNPNLLRTKINNSLNFLNKPLTIRESEVLFYYIIQNKTQQEVAQILNISRSSVKEYLKRASLKLGCSSIAEVEVKVKEILKSF